MIIKWSLNSILGASSLTMNLMFRKWGQYWLSYAAQIDHASDQNYSNLSVLMTVFQALKPSLTSLVVSYMTCTCETFSCNLWFCQLGTFVSSAQFVDLIIQLELNCHTREKGQSDSGWPLSQRSASSLLGHHWISYLERLPVGLLSFRFYNGNNSKTFI